MTRNAERNNRKLFPVFRRHLANGALRAYIDTADKLNTWLSKDKAYYPKARPDIVDLLEVAHSAVCRQNDQSPLEENLFFAPFERVMQTMSPYYVLFTEETLKARLRPLLASVGINPDELVAKYQMPSGQATISVNTAPIASVEVPTAMNVPPQMSASANIPRRASMSVASTSMPMDLPSTSHAMNVMPTYVPNSPSAFAPSVTSSSPPANFSPAPTPALSHASTRTIPVAVDIAASVPMPVVSTSAATNNTSIPTSSKISAMSPLMQNSGTSTAMPVLGASTSASSNASPVQKSTPISTPKAEPIPLSTLIPAPAKLPPLTPVSPVSANPSSSRAPSHSSAVKIKPKAKKRFTLDYIQADLEEYDEHRGKHGDASSRGEVGKLKVEKQPAHPATISASDAKPAAEETRGQAVNIEDEYVVMKESAVPAPASETPASANVHVKEDVTSLSTVTAEFESDSARTKLSSDDTTSIPASSEATTTPPQSDAGMETEPASGQILATASTPAVTGNFAPTPPSPAPARVSPVPARESPAPVLLSPVPAPLVSPTRSSPTPARSSPARQSPAPPASIPAFAQTISAPAQSSPASARPSPAPAPQSCAYTRSSPAPAGAAPAVARTTPAPVEIASAIARPSPVSAKIISTSAHPSPAPVDKASASARSSPHPVHPASASVRPTSALPCLSRAPARPSPAPAVSGSTPARSSPAPAQSTPVPAEPSIPAQSTPDRASESKSTTSPKRALRMGKRPRKGPPGFKTLPVLVTDADGTTIAVERTGFPGAAAQSSSTATSRSLPAQSSKRKGKQRESDRLPTSSHPTSQADPEARAHARTPSLPPDRHAASSPLKTGSTHECDMDISEGVSANPSRAPSRAGVVEELAALDRLLEVDTLHGEGNDAQGSQPLKVDRGVPSSNAGLGASAKALPSGGPSLPFSSLPLVYVVPSDQKPQLEKLASLSQQPEAAAVIPETMQEHNRLDIVDISPMNIDMDYPSGKQRAKRQGAVGAVAASDAALVMVGFSAMVGKGDAQVAAALPDERQAHSKGVVHSTIEIETVQTETAHRVDVVTDTKNQSTVGDKSSVVQGMLNDAPATSAPNAVAVAHTTDDQTVSTMASAEQSDMVGRKRVRSPSDVSHGEGPRRKPRTLSPPLTVALADSDAVLHKDQLGATASSWPLTSSGATPMDIDRAITDSSTISPNTVGRMEVIISGAQGSNSLDTGRPASVMSLEEGKLIPVIRRDEGEITPIETQEAEATIASGEDVTVSCLVDGARYMSIIDGEKGEVSAVRRREELRPSPVSVSESGIQPEVDFSMLPIVDTSSACVETKDTDSPSKMPIFDSSMVVLGCARGSPDPSIHLPFELSSAEATELCRWHGRYDTKDDLSTSKCLSFACYSFTECLANVRNNPNSSIEEMALASLPSPWPRDGRLWAEMDNGETQKQIMLSPPILPKEDVLVDLSGLVKSGKNFLHLFQLRDHSDTVFVVHLHSPTVRQLAELKRRRDQDKEWHAFIHDRLHSWKLPVYHWPDEVSLQPA